MDSIKRIQVGAQIDKNIFFMILEYYDAAEPPVRCGVSHLSGPTEPLYKLTILPVLGQAHRPLSWKCPWKDPHIRYQFYMSRRICDP